MMGVYEVGLGPVWSTLLVGWIWALVIAAAIFGGIVLIARVPDRRPSETPREFEEPKRSAA